MSRRLAAIHDFSGCRVGVLARASDRSTLLCLLDDFLLFFLLHGCLVLLLLLVLLVRAQRHVHFHLNFRPCCGGDCRSQNFIREKDLVEHFVVGARAHKVLVVNIRVLGWINSDEVAASLVLSNRLSDVVFVSEPRCLLHGFHQDGVFLWVFHSEALNHLLELCTRSVACISAVVAMRLEASALDALAQATFLALAVESLHTVLDLVNGLFLAVKALYTNQIEHIHD